MVTKLRADMTEEEIRKANEYHRRYWEKNKERRLAERRERHAKKMAERDPAKVKRRRGKNNPNPPDALAAERLRQWKLKNRIRDLFHRVRGAAKEKGVPCDLDLEFVEAFFGAETCAVTGIRFEETPKGSRPHPFSLSIDRIVPALGYVKENVRPVCWMYNTMKGTCTDEDCLRLAQAIVAKRQSDLRENGIVTLAGTV